MRQFSISDLLRGINAVTIAADRAPVAITRNRKPRYVQMTYDMFHAMTRGREDPRRVFGPGETPRELADLILPELDRLIEEGGTADA